MKRNMIMTITTALLLTMTSCGSTAEETRDHDRDRDETSTVTIEEQSATDSLEQDENSTLLDDSKGTDIPEVAKLDPFAGLEVQFDGISPYVNYNINNSKCDPKIQQYVTYEVEERENLANGDHLKVKAVLNSSNPTQIDFELAIEEQEYEVQGMPEYVTDFSKIDTTALDTEIQQYMDSHYMFRGHSDTVMENGALHGETYYGQIMGIELESIFQRYNINLPGDCIYFDHFISSEVVHRYQLIAKQNYYNDLDEKNYYYVEYINRYAIRDRGDDKGVYKYDEAPQYETGIVVFIPIKNVIVYPDGTLKYDLDIDHSGDISEETAYFDNISSKGEKYNINEIV